MNRDRLIDIMRKELMRQKEQGKVSVVPVETPDSFQVIGVIDVHALADAIRRRD